MATMFCMKARRACLALVLAATALAFGSAAQAQDAPPSPESALQVNINQADAETIADVLVGVGLSRAKAIVEYREEHGPFGEVNDLVEVKGIGQATLETNRERIRLE